MKKHATVLLFVGLLRIAGAQAGTVIEEVPDTLPGKGFGGLSGFMAGAVAGGPIGAIVGAGVGWLVGGETQKASGLSGSAYRVAGEGGSEFIVRSPKREWSPGDRVGVVGNRLIAEDEASGSARAASFHTTD